MRSNNFSSRTRRRAEGGQALLFTLLGLGLFLIGAMAFAVDMSNLWFNRQSAQTAADAACAAGAMDMLVGDTNGAMPAGANFTAAAANTYDCSTASPLPSPCSYASLNGFNSNLSRTSTALGNNVFIDFPATGPAGVTAPPASVAPSAFIRVQITENIPTFFAGLLRGRTKQNIGATAICGVLEAQSPIPILILDPTRSGTLHMNGGGSVSSPTCNTGPPCGDIVIAGGPSKSIQVNSSSTTAVQTGNNPTINLCGGGSNYCGSSMGAWGTNPTPTGFWNTTTTCSMPKVNGLCTGTQTAPQFNSPSAPIADPLAFLNAPAIPNFAGANRSGPYRSAPAGQFGCPLTSGSCAEYGPGYYPGGIDVSNQTAIFDPGIYYIGGTAGTSQRCNNGGSAGSFCEGNNSCIRPSTVIGDGSGGTIFYFADSNSVNVGSNGGNCSGAVPFNTATGALGLGVKCTSSTQIPNNLPATLTGSVLLAPCNKPDPTTNLCTPNCSINPGTNGGGGFGDPQGTGDATGEQRGVLFFQAHSVNATNNPNWGGGGSMLLAGTMYFHQTGGFNDKLGLGGNSGSSTYVLGDIIVDQLDVGGSGQIIMDLNPSAAYSTLKASLLQ
jgi:Flp pilus assembly protein TadG